MVGRAGTVLRIPRTREVVYEKLLLIVKARQPEEKIQDRQTVRCCLEEGVVKDEMTWVKSVSYCQNVSSFPFPEDLLCVSQLLSDKSVCVRTDAARTTKTRRKRKKNALKPQHRTSALSFSAGVSAQQ